MLVLFDLLDAWVEWLGLFGFVWAIGCAVVIVMVLWYGCV